MTILRRTFMGSAFALSASGNALADTASYQYDALGRIVRVTFADGSFVAYSYDAAGNRTEVIRSDNTTYTATLQITGSGPVNLRSVANAASYNGARHATITFQVATGVTILSGIDTGIWSSQILNTSLTLQVFGKVYGIGGVGGQGAGTGPGSVGGNGGDAIYCRENLTIVVNSGGEVKGGGGGGGGGGAWMRNPSEPFFYNGGGGGGGFPSGAGGPEGVGDADKSNPGASGTTSGGGAGGTGGASTPGSATRINGAGGAGGGAAAAGAAGGGASGSGGSGTWEEVAPGTGGQPGYAIRKNGTTVTVTNDGVITGAQG